MPPGRPIVVPAPVVNYVPPGGPPWWLTGFIAIAAAVVGVVATSIATRGRDYERWLYEKRFEVAVDLLHALNRADSLALPVAFNDSNHLNDYGRKDFWKSAEALGDPRSTLTPLVAEELRDRLVAVTSNLVRLHAAWHGDESKRELAAETATTLSKESEKARTLISSILDLPPKLGFLASASRHRPASKRASPKVRR